MPQLSPLFPVGCLLGLLVYWALPARHRPTCIGLESLLFLALVDRVSCLVLIGLTAFVYTSARKSWPWTAPIGGLVLTFFFVRGYGTLHVGSTEAGLMITGFGFYVFRLVHYTVEQKLGAFPTHSFSQVLSYVAFYPSVLIGPIHRFETHLNAELRLRWNPAVFSRGLERILYGYAKLVVVANWLIRIELRQVASATLPEDPGVWVLFECLAYGLHLYVSFAGASDIAIGLAALHGYELPENFDAPFLKPNLGEFWRSWHMTLSDMCRRYVFTPVMAKYRHPTLALVASMVVLGLWHELSMRYLLWGVYHGVGLAVWRAWNARGPFQGLKSPVLGAIGRTLSTALTFTFVTLSFGITRNPDMESLWRDMMSLLGWIL